MQRRAAKLIGVHEERSLTTVDLFLYKEHLWE